jgi:hypothetical protein
MIIPARRFFPIFPLRAEDGHAAGHVSLLELAQSARGCQQEMREAI